MEHDEIIREYRKEFEKPLADIREDPFFRGDNFCDEAWYGSFLLFTRIGVCRPAPEHVEEVQKALKIMGYSTHAAQRDGKIYVMPGAQRSDRTAEKRMKVPDRSDER